MTISKASGDPVFFVLASGPSMAQADVDAVRGRGHVIAINNQVFAAPWAEIHYVADASWFEAYADRYNALDFKGERFCASIGGLKFKARRLMLEGGEGLGRKVIRSGNNSGYQAINFAYLRGARTIVILGLDMQYGPNGEKHNHPDHGKTPAGVQLGNFNRGMPELCIPKFAALARDLRAEGVRVINSSRRTALTVFERMPLSDALAVIGDNHPAARESSPAAPIVCPAGPVNLTQNEV